MIRPATNHDRDAVRALVFDVLAEHGLSPDPTGTDSDLDDLEREYVNRGGAFDVLVDDHGVVIGSVGLCRVDGRTCELRKMYLDRNHRGRGFGRALIEHALARAAAMGFGRIELETSSKLPAALTMYERCGFLPFHKEHMAGRCDITLCLELLRSRVST